ATNTSTLEEYFAQLYAHTDIESNPSSGGRSMVAHYATRNLNDDGSWRDLTKIKNSASDFSCIAGQMPRLMGQALASKLYRQNKDLHQYTTFSDKGNEVAFGTIGDAGTSEGMFFEIMNAAGVLQVPMVMSVWDDGFGISVPKKHQTTKADISEAMAGFEKTEESNGLIIYKVKGWDYPELCRVYQEAVRSARRDHSPILIHVDECTQQQGHSTSGSHERYKTDKELAWADEWDCIKKMREWMINMSIASEEELNEIDAKAKKIAKTAQVSAWETYTKGIHDELETVSGIFTRLEIQSKFQTEIKALKQEISNLQLVTDRKSIITRVKKVLRITRDEDSSARKELLSWLDESNAANYERYNSYLYSNSADAAIKIKEVKAEYNEDAKIVDGREILKHNFDAILTQNPKVFVFGQDVGTLGGVNLSMEGMQAKHGKLRVDDAGIREASIMGKAFGSAQRGLRPIAEIQYLDYLVYGLPTMTDDMASLHYRTKGGQKAPVIIRTRGHRLEGIWHSGSPMGMIINAVRGMYVIVPRNMTQAAGFYNTMLESDDPSLIIEPLSSYRLKEKLPSNLGQFRIPLGQPEIIKEGSDITIVTYAFCCNIALAAAKDLEKVGISIEIIDIQTLLPFDVNHSIINSIEKTNKVLFFDEDVPGGASAFMMQKVIEEQEAYKYLDSQPRTLTAKEHRPAYGTDGDYFSKPSSDEVFETIYTMMHEVNPNKFPVIY
ncbi:MAG: transketolase, partial [Flavobacteriales bacterium]|nr:transketolase [Flavobacteriales bacterium]